jgi:class 3 adenylate cyclase/predicted ATPase
MRSSIPDLAEWLAGHDLGQYARNFADNHIDDSVLADLTETDLEKIGVSSLGHRKKLLKVIGLLMRDTNGAAHPVAEAATPILAARPRTAEFRQVTIMFSDLVGSTQLSEQLDPEDVRELIEAYRQRCNEAIGRHGGEIAHYAGDGVMAIWGYPNARENDAGRAINAALQIVADVPAISGPVSLSCRVGICTGPAVVGHIGDGGTMDAVGEAPNVAARLQTLATANTVLVSESTRRLVSAAFNFRDLGLRELKGVTAPLRIYRALSAKLTGSRFDAMHTGSLTTFIGRSGELRLLLDRWQKAKEGDGQIVLLSGIPGVGKSRLLHEIKSLIRPEPHTLLSYQGSPYHAQSAFAPVIVQIEQAAQLTGRIAEADRFARLQRYLPDLSGHPVEPALLIARLLSICPEDTPGLSALSPPQIKNKTISALVDTIKAFSAMRPTLCMFEDAHWLDPSTLELLELIVSRIDRARVLLVVSCRPEFRPAWINHPNTTTLSLSRLSQSEGTTMIENLMKGGDIPQSAHDKIIEKADGVPLFIEELISSLLTAPSRGEIHRAMTPRVPDTLSDALMERLDRVAPGRHFAQVAAVIGREFSFDLLSMASQGDEADILAALSLLEQADIVCRVEVWPVVRFAFKHALLRDAIYDSLLKSRRQQIHADIAAALAHGFPDLVENQPEVLAYHYEEAADHEQAIRCWFESGQRAFAQSANVEAIANLRKALALLVALPETPERIAQVIDIQLAMGLPLIAVKGYASTDTREAFSQARALCLRMGNTPGYFQALYGLWGHSWMCGKNDEALRMADEAWSHARQLSDPVPQMVAHRMLGSTLLTTGDFQASADHFRETISLSVMTGERQLYSRYMVEPQVASLLLLSWDLWFLGYPDQSLARVSEALTMARDLGHPYTVAFAHYMTSVVHLLRGDARRAVDSAESSLEISREHRLSLYEILSRISRGRAIADLGRLDEGLAETALGIDEARRIGLGFMLPMMTGWLAELHGRAGSPAAALAIVDEALAVSGDATGMPWEAELHRLRAWLLLRIDPSAATAAETCLQTSISVARRQNAMSLQLRAATCLARLWRTQGRHDDARALMAPLGAFFGESLATADPTHARRTDKGQQKR